MNDKDKAKTIQDFSKKLLDGMQEPDPEFNKIVSEHFWEMVEVK